MSFKPKISESKKGKATVFLGLCKGCGLCIQKCPVKAISFSAKDLGVYSTPSVEIDLNKCIFCGICETICPDCALKVSKKSKASSQNS
jgi:2-oxoglutarate ferredoxin oxidoreductase subunit delta